MCTLVLIFHSNPRLRHYPFTPKSPPRPYAVVGFFSAEQHPKRLRVNRYLRRKKATEAAKQPQGLRICVFLYGLRTWLVFALQATRVFLHVSRPCRFVRSPGECLGHTRARKTPIRVQDCKSKSPVSHSSYFGSAAPPSSHCATSMTSRAAAWHSVQRPYTWVIALQLVAIMVDYLPHGEGCP